MEPIKNYNQVEPENEAVDFRISRMEDIWDARGGAADEPHRHDYYTVLMVKRSSGTHHIDFRAYPMNGKQVFFVNPEQVHQVVEEERSEGFAILFSCDFLNRNNIPPSFIDDLNLFNDHNSSPPLHLNDQESEKLVRICEQMVEVCNTSINFSDQAVASLLQLFLINCNNYCTLPQEDTQTREAGNTILRQFKEMVNSHYFHWHSASEYANELNVTTDHLNRVVRLLTGKTLKGYIHARILVGAKRLLYFSDQSLKEISYDLGFSEPANFSAFFKKQTGLSPSEFRKNEL